MRQIVVEDNGPASRVVVPVQPGCTILKGYCGSGKSKTLEAIAVGLGNKGYKLSPREGTKRGKVDCLGVMLSISAGRTSRVGESDAISLEDFCLGDLIDPPVKDIDARNRHGIKSLLRITDAKADPALFHRLVGDKAAFDAIIPPDSVKSDDLVDMAGKVKRALEKCSRDADAIAETEEAKAAADRNAADGLDMTIDTDGNVLQDGLEVAAGVKATLDEQHRAAEKARTDAEEARKQLAAIGEKPNAVADAAAGLAKARANATAAMSVVSVTTENVRRLEHELELAKADRNAAGGNAAAANREVESATEAVAAAERSQLAVAGWQKAIDDAANVTDPHAVEIAAAETAVEQARKQIEQAAVVRAAKERIERATAHQHAAAEQRLKAVHLRDAARDTDSILSEAVASTRFAVQGTVLLGTLPSGERKPFFELSDGEKVMIAVAEKIERVRAAEPDETKLGIIDLPQRTWQDLPPSVRERLAAYAAAKNVCVVSANVTDDPELTAEVWTPGFFFKEVDTESRQVV